MMISLQKRNSYLVEVEVEVEVYTTTNSALCVWYNWSNTSLKVIEIYV